MAAWNAGVSGSFTNNIISRNGWNGGSAPGERVGLWLNGAVEVRFNDLWSNAPVQACKTVGQTCQELELIGGKGNVGVDSRTGA